MTLKMTIRSFHEQGENTVAELYRDPYGQYWLSLMSTGSPANEAWKTRGRVNNPHELAQAMIDPSACAAPDGIDTETSYVYPQWA